MMTDSASVDVKARARELLAEAYILPSDRAAFLEGEYPLVVVNEALRAIEAALSSVREAPRERLFRAHPASVETVATPPEPVDKAQAERMADQEAMMDCYQFGTVDSAPIAASEGVGDADLGCYDCGTPYADEALREAVAKAICHANRPTSRIWGMWEPEAEAALAAAIPAIVERVVNEAIKRTEGRIGYREKPALDSLRLLRESS